MARDRLTEKINGMTIPYANPIDMSPVLDLIQIPFPETENTEKSNIFKNMTSFISNKYNSWAPKWGANTTNALVTGILSGLGELGANLGANDIYIYFQQQENLAVQNAMEQARRIQLKGDITLRNMEVAHTINQGKQELAVAAAGGNMSGSFLDMMMQNKKHALMDERTAEIQTIWDVSNAKRAGYIQAIDTAGKAMSYGYEASGKALDALGAFIRGVSGGLLKDKREYDNQEAAFQQTGDKTTYAFKALERQYGSTYINSDNSRPISDAINTTINNSFGTSSNNSFSMLNLE